MSALRDSNSFALLEENLLKQLQGDPDFLMSFSERILNEFFPESYHDDILDAVHLTYRIDTVVQKRRRDPEFRKKVGFAYNHRCAICEFHLPAAQSYIGMEAAHVICCQSNPSIGMQRKFLSVKIFNLIPPRKIYFYSLH